MGEGRAPKVGPLEGMQEQLPRDAAVERTGRYSQGESPPGERRSSGGEGALGYKVNRRKAREGALGYKVNRRKAREGALGYNVTVLEVNACLQHEKPPGSGQR